MGCYGIGVSRLLPAIIEQHHDDDGIIWPYEAAPYKVLILVVNVSDEAQYAAALRLHDDLERKGVDVILDDRNQRAGAKFKDADLLEFLCVSPLVKNTKKSRNSK